MGQSNLTQLENGGTESGQIRLIVWKGAWEIFKHYPILGSGVETFAYSYYQFRPVEHNLVSEWDFLYNKAHNEYLNYLANTGLVGFGTYLILIGSFIYWNIKQKSLFSISLLVSYISYLVQNIFGFSVVITALFFYLFPALAFIFTDSIKPLKLPIFIAYTKTARIFIIFSILYLLFSLLKLWYADTLFATQSYNYLASATLLNPGEPFYRSALGYGAAVEALAVSEADATRSAGLKEEAVNVTERVLQENPKNTSFFRTAIRTYYHLSALDESFTQKTLFCSSPYLPYMVSPRIRTGSLGS